MSHVLPSDTNRQEEILKKPPSLRLQLAIERNRTKLAIAECNIILSELNEEKLKNHRLTEELKRLNQIIGMWEKRYESQQG